MQNLSSFRVFNASAGSGKTYTLVKEYVKIVLSTSDPNRFQNILAITFTNKAAAEMKARVISNLREFADADILKKKTTMFLHIEQETQLQDEQIHQRAKQVLKSILHQYAAFNITTIDSFTHRLIRNFAFDLGLSLTFDVEMDTQSLLNEAVDLLIAKIGENGELTKALIDFSLQKADEDKAWDITRELREIAQILLNENDLSHIQQLDDKSLADFIELKKNLQKHSNHAITELKRIGESGLQLIEENNIKHSDFYYSQFPKHFQNCISNVSQLSFDPAKGLAKSIENQQYYTKNKSEETKNSIERIIGPLRELYDRSRTLHQEYTLHRLFLGSLIPLAVLKKINECLQEIKEEKNIYLHAEFNALISKHLRAQPAAFIYERIGEKYKHYFIDEMQDTSKLQWQNLIPLIGNALSTENSSLLLVGDSKQSIYRWRGGEAEQFMDLSNDENPFFIDKQVEQLAINYRSHSEIINFNNGFFQFMSAYFNNDSHAKIYFNENQQLSTDKLGGYVNLAFIDSGLSAAEKDKIYSNKIFQTIKTICDQFDLNEICILTRTRKQGVVIANFLTENGIDIISSETLLLDHSHKVQFIIHLLTYLNQRANKEAQLEVLYFLYDFMNLKVDKHVFLSEMLAMSIYSFCETLKEYNIFFSFDRYDRLPFYESIEYIIRCFKLDTSIDGYLLSFLDEALQFTRKNATGTTGFLRYWNDQKDRLSISVPEEKDAVRIMTIHKSKGLEFPVVIFAYDLDIYRELNPKTWYPIQDKEQYNDFDTLLVNVNKTLENVNELGTFLYQKRKNELALDNVNLLYVALTRAIEQLYVISEKRKPSEEPRWYSHFFMEYLKSIKVYDEKMNSYEFGETERTSEKSIRSKKSHELEEFISSSWQDQNINIVASSNLLWDVDRGPSIIYGNLIHEILSRIKTKADIEDAIEQYHLNGTIAHQEIEAIARVIHSVIFHPELAVYFQQNLTVFCEREILTSDKEVIIPDRLVIDEQGRATIIDYKTGTPDKKYHSQLLKYARSVEALGYEVIRQLLVYIGEDIMIEEVN